MKKNLLLSLLGIVMSISSYAQCTTANVNWDNLDFLVSTGNYAGFVTPAQSMNQRFAFGPSAMTVQTTSNITISGDNGTHTGSTNTNGAGDDIGFTTTTTAGSSTITLTFDDPVSNLLFSIYDIDNNQRVNVSAYNGALPVTTTLSIASGSGSGMTFTLNPGTSPRANGISGNYGVTDNRGAVNVSITSAVTSVVLSFTNATGDFWISDIQGCVPGSFPTNYYNVSQPFTGQPSYMTVTPDTNLVLSVNPSNGQVKTLFQEPASQYVNSMGYDPYNRELYYTLDDVDPAVTQRGIKKYDFNTESIIPVLADVTSIGIPLFESGVESGGGAYYGGCYYLGIEGGNATNNSNRECIIWRIEFDASNNPVSASQVVAFPADNGSGSKRHDWGDFVINNGILYDFNSTAVSGVYSINQYNLQTGAMNVYNPSFAPKQNSVAWDGRLFHISNIVRQYNGTTGYAASGFTLTGPGWVGGSGDAGEAFKPKADFGDAPSSYDPVTPALHERDVNLRLGNTFDHEWVKAGATVNADADGSDEDGISTVPLLCPCSGNFFIPVSVYNNTGANATLIAWLDYDGDGVFESTEAQTATVSSSASMQTINLNWTNAWTTLPDNAITYLRIRLTSASNGMTTSMASGYFDDGEVEDYRVVVDGFPLAVNILSFTAAKDGNGNAQIGWRVNEDPTLSHYYLQKSTNGKDWMNVNLKKASGKNTTVQYNFEDPITNNGTIFYRLQMVHLNGISKLSEVRHLSFGRNDIMSLSPNPAQHKTSVTFFANKNETTLLSVINTTGAILHKQEVLVSKGKNIIELDLTSFAAGVYTVQMITSKGKIIGHFTKN